MRDHSTPTMELSQQSSQSGEPPLRATEWSRPPRQEVRDVTAAAGVTDAATVHRALLPASSLATAEKGAAAESAPESEEPAQPECWRGRRAWRGHRAGTAPGQEEQRESCRSSTQRARPRGTRNVLGRGKSRPRFSRPGGGVILDGHLVPPREKGPSLPAMCRGQTQVDAGSGARVPLRSFSGEGGTTPRGARG